MSIALENVKARPQSFPWGTVMGFHEIKDYCFVEYEETGSRQRLFHSFIDGKDTCESFHTLDGALIGTIVRHRLGNNQQPLARGICRALMIDLGD